MNRNRGQYTQVGTRITHADSAGMQDRTAHTQATVTLGQCHACSSGVVDHQCGSNVDYATTMRCDPGSLTGNTGNTAITPQISTRSVLESKVAQHIVNASTRSVLDGKYASSALTRKAQYSRHWQVSTQESVVQVKTQV